MSEQGEDLQEIINKAEAGDAAAMHTLSTMYFFGNGAPQDHPKALQWLQKAADLGFLEAKVNLGVWYQQGVCGLKVDSKKAFELIQDAALKGNPNAMGFLSSYYLEGIYIPADLEKGFDFLLKAGEAGDVFSMVVLSGVYGTGLFNNKKIPGINKDISKKMYWLQRAAECGDRSSQEIIGVAMLFGKDMPLDRDGGIALLEKASEQDSILAESILGFCYENGLGVEENTEKAIEWYLKAIRKKNNFFPVANVQRIKLSTIRVNSKEKEVCYIYPHHPSFAWYRLGQFYENGVFFDMNMDAAKDCYKKACDLGEELGCKRLQELSKIS